jgi:hypothetical protein
MDLETKLEYESYEFSGIDQDAGNRKPILIPSGSDISVDEPTADNSQEFLAEAEAVKSKIKSMSNYERENVDYWTNNAVLH